MHDNIKSILINKEEKLLVCLFGDPNWNYLTDKTFFYQQKATLPQESIGYILS